jgi:DNA-binding LacI/PurR family transcriptional regulator
MGVTIKDIGKLAGVSHTTVSRALNDSKLISEVTRERIKRVAKELNYVPNFNAKSLVLDKSYIIGLFFSTIANGTSSGFFQQAVIGVNSIIKDRYNVVVKGIDEYQNFRGINSNSFDGVIVMSQSDEDNSFIYYLLDKKIPVVVLNRDIKDTRIVNILSDDRRGAYELVRYLIQNGHKKIGAIEGKGNFKSSAERKEGYILAMSEEGLEIPDNYIVKGDYNIESSHKAMKQLLSLKDIPSAVFCFNDDMALGAINATLEAGLRVPEDISIVGFDDSTFSAYISPALTTVKRAVEGMGSEGAKCLIDLIEQGKSPKSKVYIKTELIIRKSIKTINLIPEVES